MLDENRKLLYEKIADVSEQKQTLMEENQRLKKQLLEYDEKLFDNFCEFVESVIENIDFNKDDIDKVISEKNEDAIEKKMAKHFANKIVKVAKEQEISAKNIAYMIYDKLKKFM